MKAIELLSTVEPRRFYFYELYDINQKTIWVGKVETLMQYIVAVQSCELNKKIVDSVPWNLLEDYPVITWWWTTTGTQIDYDYKLCIALAYDSKGETHET